MKRLYDKALMDQIAKVYGNEVAFLSEFSKALLDIIREGLIRDGLVRLHQFGTFKLKWMKSRNGVNPSTGEKILIQARPRVIFTPAKALKERVEPNPPELQPFVDPVKKAEVVEPLPIVAAADINVDSKPEETVQQKLVDELDSLQTNVSVDELEELPANEFNEELKNEADDDLSEILDIIDKTEISESLESLEPVVELETLEESVSDESLNIGEDETDSPVHENSLDTSSLLDTTDLEEVQSPEPTDNSQLTELDPISDVTADDDLEDIKSIINETDISDLTDSAIFNEVIDNDESKPEEVIASIQDEIEILEQVVDVLQTENLEDAIEATVEVDQNEALEDLETIDEAPVEPFNEVTEEEPVVAKSEWLDNSIVDDIKGISELQYFKKTETEVAESTVEESVASSHDEAVTTAVAESNAEKYGSLDINLDDLPQDNVQPLENNQSEKTSKPWFAIAASVIVLIAAGVLFNALNTSSTVIIPDDQLASNTDHPNYVFSYEENVAVEEPINEVKEIVIASAPVHVPVVVVNDKVELESLASEDEVNNAEVLPVEPVKPNVVVKETNESFENDSDSIVVSTEKYDELQRVSSEQSVFFAAMDYKLVNGDSLWRLAKKHYVNPFYWPHIYQANRNRIVNPDKVKIGKTVELPTLYGRPNSLTQRDKHNIAMGYYQNYLYHKEKGNPYAYFSLIGVEKYDASLLIEYKEEIERSDINNLALLTE